MFQILCVVCVVYFWLGRQTARAALGLYQQKTIEISEETSLLFVKACCRVGKPMEAVNSLADPSLRLGLWSNTTCWNVVAAHLEDVHLLESSSSVPNEEEEGGDAAEEAPEAAAAAAEKESGDAGAADEEGEISSSSPAAASRATVVLGAMETLGVAPTAVTHKLVEAPDGSSEKAAAVAEAQGSDPMMRDEDALPDSLLMK
jgi:hypothetical protein